jgi:centromere-localized protein 2
MKTIGHTTKRSNKLGQQVSGCLRDKPGITAIISTYITKMPPQPPTELQILHSYLLHPSPLPTILPYKAFLSLLPKSSASLSQTHATELNRLYRDLHFQRDVIVDDVRRRIEAECVMAPVYTARLKRQVMREELSTGPKRQSRKRKRQGAEDDDVVDASDEEVQAEDREVQFDTALHSGIPLSNTAPKATPRHNHTAESLLSAMESATRDLSSTIADLQSSIEKLARLHEEKVGNLSDLRYGRFAGTRNSGNTTSGSLGTDGAGGVEEEVIGGLEELKNKLAKRLPVES